MTSRLAPAFVLLLFGCADGVIPPAAPTTPAAPPAASSVAAASAAPSVEKVHPQGSQKKRNHKEAYEKATELAAANRLDEAIAQLKPFADATRESTNDPLAYWIHNQLTWLYWGKGDVTSALEETDLGAKALNRSTLTTADIESMRLHALWDRAYLLLENKDAFADRAFSDYESLATKKNDHDGLNVLKAFFAARKKKPAEAMAAAKKVDVERDTDLQDLYVIALAFDAGGDHKTAEAVRTKICGAPTYMMKPLIVAQMEREGFRCKAP